MSKEIVINVSGEQSRIAIVENGELVELYVENPDNVRTIGDIHLGRVRRILPGIKAAFVDIGHKQDAFLHFSDLSDNVPALLELSDGRIPERAESLTKAPANAPDNLELETAEEQQATRRRREMKRSSPSRGRATTRDDAGKEEGAESTEKKPSRRRGPQQRRPGARPEASAVAPAILPPEAADIVARPDEDDKAEESTKTTQERPKRSRRRGRRRPAATKGRTEESTETQEKTEASTSPERSRSRRSEPRAKATSRTESKTPEPKQTGSSDGKEAQSGLTVASTIKPPSRQPDAPAGDEPSSAPRLAPGSKFRIDLTGGPPRREEEEEEEERTSSSRRRRSASGRSRGRSRSKQSRSGDNKQGNNRSGGNGKATAEKHPSTYLKQDQKLLVKISKEPISAKGSRVSTDISLAGRFLVLIPAADYVAVSKKIESSKERRRLRALARSLLPEGFGLIVRTVAANRDAKVLDTDLQLLLGKWARIEEQLKRRPQPPVQLYEDVNMVSSIVRDLFTEDYDRITIDDPTVYRNIKTYVQAVAPQMAGLVQLHQRKEPVFQVAGIEKDVRAAFEMRVDLPGGGYLFIEHTEAMHVVDVNSGRAGRGMTQEENALKVNLEAAREIAKQLRLRDLGGIICVDFIDMRSDAYRRKVYDELQRAFRRDRAVTKMLPMSDFGVLEITRQRLRPSITTTLDVDDVGGIEEDGEEGEVSRRPSPEPRPSRPTETAAEIIAHLERWLVTYRTEVLDQHRARPVLLRVHPFLGAYLQKGFPSLFTRWKFKTRLKLVLDFDDKVDPLTFSFRDQKSGKNLTRKYDPDRREA